MDVVIRPGARLEGHAAIPGDKSIAHRWLILSVTAKGMSRLVGLPPSLDVRSTAECLSKVAGKSRRSLDVFARDARAPVEGRGSTWNAGVEVPAAGPLEVEGDGRDALVQAASDLDCGNSGTSMRLLAGVLAAAPLTSVLTGDPSLSVRPMERVAAPLRAMGAEVETTEGHAPLLIRGTKALQGARFAPEVPSAQVKSAILFAGVAADGITTVREPAPTRDHTERALEALGAPVERDGEELRIRRFQHGGFEGRVPGDPSSAAFLIAAAALTGSAITITGVGLNPSRLHFLDVMERMGIVTQWEVEGQELGEPMGSIEVEPCDGLRAVRVGADEVPLVIDEVPVLAALAIHAAADSWFLNAAELRVKESDRLGAITRSVRDLGGAAADEGSDLVIAGGGLEGGRTSSGGDHRIAMAMAVAALGARGPSRIDGIDAADVSFPGFVATLGRLGARIEAP